MEDIKVSVIIPVYNSEKYIVECAESVLSQDYKNIELILVDDGSTDDSLNICREIAKADERVKVFHKENGGASSARNFGIENSLGKYIYFVDSDDFVEKNAINSLVLKAEETGADLLYFEAYNFSETSSLKALHDGFTFNFSYSVTSGENLIAKLIKNRDYHAAPFLYFIKRELLNGLRFKEGVMFEDELFSFNILLRASKVVCLSEKFYKRRMREGSVMTSVGKGVYRFNSITAVLKEVIDIYSAKQDKTRKKYLERVVVLWQGRYEELSVTEKEEVKEEYRLLLGEIRENNYFSSAQVKLRLKSFTLWRIYTAPQKFLIKLKKILRVKI